jgi:hypothetical protein
MTDEDDLIQSLDAAIKLNRPYAGFFDWPDRAIAELGVAKLFTEIALCESGLPFTELHSRLAGQDPPDCEACDSNGRRVAIEVTELVDGRAAAAARRRSGSAWAQWDAAKIQQQLQNRLTDKDGKVLKGGPYDEYIVLIHTDEPALPLDVVESALLGHTWHPVSQIHRAYLVVSYDPSKGRSSYVRLL